MRLVFATSNPHKVEEVRVLVPAIDILSLMDIGWHDEIAETETTLEGNALLKARTVADALDIDCFSEDTGLEIAALGGKPGVHSARYAGPQRDAEANMNKVLREMEGVEDRRAQFRTVMALIVDGASYCFHGVVTGRLHHTPRGDQGFGYDPIFIPDGYNQTFAELGDDVKSEISHRARAMRKLVTFLQQYIRHKNPG